MRSAAAEREWRWRAGLGAQRAGDARGGERGLREQAGASWALRPRELGQAVFWAGSGERKWAAGWAGTRKREGWPWAGWAATLVWVSLFLSISIFFPIPNSTQLNPNNYLNSNLNLNSTLKLKQLKQMHQHECNNKNINL